MSEQPSDQSPSSDLPETAPAVVPAIQILRLFLLRTLLICVILAVGSIALKALLYLSSPHTRAILRGEGRSVEYPLPFGEETLRVQGRLTSAQFRLTYRKWGFFDLYVVIQGEAQPDGQGYRLGGISAGLSPSQTRHLRFRG